MLQFNNKEAIKSFRKDFSLGIKYIRENSYHEENQLENRIIQFLFENKQDLNKNQIAQYIFENQEKLDKEYLIRCFERFDHSNEILEPFIERQIGATSQNTISQDKVSAIEGLSYNEVAYRQSDNGNNVSEIDKILEMFAPQSIPEQEPLYSFIEQYARPDIVDTAVPRPEPGVLVFQGGGAKGVCYPGAIEALQEADYLSRAYAVCGASAGAITAALLALGYDAEQFRLLSEEMNFNDFKDTNGSRLPEKLQFVKALANYNCWTGDNFLNWILARVESILGDPFATFADLERAKATDPALKSLIVLATSAQGAVVAQEFSYEQTPDVCIASAVRASMAFPAGWAPHKILKKIGGKVVEGEKYYADGGMFENLPIGYADKDSLVFMNDEEVDPYSQRWHAGIRYDRRNKRVENERASPNPHTMGFTFANHADNSWGAAPDSKHNLLMSLSPVLEEPAGERRNALLLILKAMFAKKKVRQDCKVLMQLYQGKIVQIDTELGTFDTNATKEQQRAAAAGAKRETERAIRTRNKVDITYEGRTNIDIPTKDNLWKFLWELDIELNRYKNKNTNYEDMASLPNNIKVRFLCRQIKKVVEVHGKSALKDAMNVFKSRKIDYQVMLNKSKIKRQNTIESHQVARDLCKRMHQYNQQPDKANYQRVVLCLNALLSRFVSIMNVDIGHGKNAIEYACSLGNNEILNLIFDTYSKVHKLRAEHKEDMLSLGSFIKENSCKLLTSVLKSNEIRLNVKLDCIQNLIARGADIMRPDQHGQTFIHKIFRCDNLTANEKTTLLKKLLKTNISKERFKPSNHTLFQDMILYCILFKDTMLFDALLLEENKDLLTLILDRDLINDELLSHNSPFKQKLQQLNVKENEYFLSRLKLFKIHFDDFELINDWVDLHQSSETLMTPLYNAHGMPNQKRGQIDLIQDMLMYETILLESPTKQFKP